MSIRLLCLACLSILLVGPAGAAEVFINGVKVTGGLRNVEFSKVDVKFDGNGNVVIDAPGYKIELAQPASPPVTTPPAAGMPVPPSVPRAAPTVPAPTAQYVPPGSTTRGDVPPANRYWLVVNTKMKGHFKMLVQANGVQVAEIPATSPQYIADISDKLRPGANQVQVTYLPSPTAPQIPPTEAVTVMIGQGATGTDGTLTISSVLATHKKETGNPSADAATLSFQVK